MLRDGLTGCPWRLREHPLVHDVQTLYASREMTDPLALAGGSHAPSVVVHALAFYDRCVSALRAHSRERADEERERRSQQRGPARPRR